MLLSRKRGFIHIRGKRGVSDKLCLQRGTGIRTDFRTVFLGIFGGQSPTSVEGEIHGAVQAERWGRRGGRGEEGVAVDGEEEEVGKGDTRGQGGHGGERR